MRQRFGLALLMLAVLVSLALPAAAQQIGTIAGKVTLPDGSPAPGVVVTATSSVLPRARTTTTLASGEYSLPQLPPGTYDVRYDMEGMAAVTRRVEVLLDQTVTLNVPIAPATVREEISVIAEPAQVDITSAELKSTVPQDVIERLPVGQEYRDLVKLVPGVYYSEENTRGQSVGGSGQDNVYQFDGVNVTLPLFGTLSAEPSSHDIAQVSVIKGGARAMDFNRSGGFTIDTVSRTGTNDFHFDGSYQVQTPGMTGDRNTPSAADFDRDRDWATLGVSGPIWREHLLFYGSYYRPTIDGTSRSTLYGSAPDFESTRNEYFGKLTWTPINSVLVQGSYRDSDRDEHGSSIGAVVAPGAVDETWNGTTSQGAENQLKIGIVEGSWVTGQHGFLSFKLTDFENDTASRPDNLLSFPIRADGSAHLDVNDLEHQGLLLVPLPVAGQDAYNAFIAPLIDRYGFVRDGVKTGGGHTGVANTFDRDDFFRTSGQIGYDYALGQNVTHDLHVGYQRYVDEEDLSRHSNGWGLIEVFGGRTSFNNQPVFYRARFWQQSLEGASGAVVPPVIHSEYESQNIELNDLIRWGSWSFNLGLMASNDTLFGQGLREGADTPSGFSLAPGHKYEMYDIGWSDTLAPRLAATWAYNARDTVYASLARYYPAASSLPRAASWDRNLAREIFAYFDASGNFIGVDPVRSSSGKFFADDLDPRAIDEYLIGTTRQFTGGWSANAYARYRYGYNFWEDTNNDARVDPEFNAPDTVPHELYIPDLANLQQGIGGSSYVIAELDGAFTKYYEVAADAEWRGTKAHFRGSYVWSHYYGNFDQDNTTTDNDQNIFVGSSFIGDGPGSQLWDHRYGDLRGDRRHQVKLYGTYLLPWNSSVGAFGVYQSGQPWEAWSGTSVYLESAGSRRTPDHYQLDLDYTQDFTFAGRYGVQLRFDLFNVFDKQTGYNIQNRIDQANFGQARTFYDPRRLQVTVRFHY